MSRLAVSMQEHEIDLDAGLITPAKEIVVDGWDPYESEPKTDGSANTIALDSTTISELRDHKARQEKERAEWGQAWQDTGKVFTKEDGSWLHPGTVPRPSAASSPRPTCHPSPCGTYAPRRRSRTEAAATSTR
ncbi:hypothetical protein [Streptomyces viridochromogenes]|uniref:hypothetical protein n=1 Tax=Streptomyces viridochromogenes TaxID=1938 RepID=UPI003CC805C2